MAGLLDIFGTGGTETLGLLGMSPADIQRNRDDAQAQALYGLAARLFQGGNTGQSIAEGLQQGQKLYSSAMQNQLQEQMQASQLQDVLRKRKQEQNALERQAQIDRAVAGAYSPAVAATEAPTPTGPLSGATFGEVGTPEKVASIDLKSITPFLMATTEGQERLAKLSALIPQLRKAGMMGEQQQDNPFLMFAQDATIPTNVRTLAQQYAKSYASGLIDPEKADDRVRQLTDMTQRAQQFEQTQAGLQAQRDQTNALARGQQGISQNLAGLRESEIAQRVQAKEEERQKPVAEAKESLNLINQAETLLKTATGSLTGTGVDVLAGAFGKSTPGAQSSAKLKAIQGALVAKMPKMSGPQSDKDVLLYREMAAQVGDSTLPTDTRQAAIDTLREIQERYAKVEPGSSKPSAPATPFKFDNAKENRYQQWLKTQGK